MQLGRVQTTGCGRTSGRAGSRAALQVHAGLIHAASASHHRQAGVASTSHCSSLINWIGVSSAQPRAGRRGAVACHVAEVSSEVELATPDIVLDIPGSDSKVLVFGVDHTSPNPHVGNYILRTKPGAVVVETAVTPEHGAVPGSGLACGDRVAEGPSSFFMRMFCQVATQLQEEGNEDITSSPLWQQVCGYYRGEQLAYVAAFATGIPLVFGDRPKDITYRRLWGLTTVEQLDEAYALQATSNYRQNMGLPEPPYPADGHVHVVDEIMMQEREAIMCRVAHDAALGRLQTARITEPCKAVVMVVGAGHIPGIKCLWSTGRWKELLGSVSELAQSSLMSAPPLEAGVPQVAAPPTPPPTSGGTAGPSLFQDWTEEAAPPVGTRGPVSEATAFGLKRGMLEAVMRLSVTQEVIDDMALTLGPVPEASEATVQAMAEIWGCTRMMLACLPPDLRQSVCGSVKGVDFEQSLDHMRSIRPVSGGPGFSEDMVAFVRGLNFDLD